MQYNLHYEEWVELLDFPNYQISTHGRVRNMTTGNILRPSPDRYGYLRLSIGNRDNVYIHRLMAETFYGIPNDDRTQVNHINCDRQNNHILNLEWCTPSENIKWGITHGDIDPTVGLQEAIKINKKRVRIVELDAEFSSVVSCADYLGVSPTNVSRCLTGSRKGQRLHGYHVEYV